MRASLPSPTTPSSTSGLRTYTKFRTVPRLDAFGNPLKGPFSSVVFAVLPGVGLDAPTITAAMAGSGAVDLMIGDPPTGAVPAEFKIFRAGPLGLASPCPVPVTFTPVTTIPRIPLLTPHTDTGLSSLSKYCYFTVAGDGVGNFGPPSNVADAVTPLLAPGGSSRHPNGIGVEAVPGNRNEVVITIKAPSGVLGRAVSLYRSPMDDDDCMSKQVQTKWNVPLTAVAEDPRAGGISTGYVVDKPPAPEDRRAGVFAGLDPAGGAGSTQVRSGVNVVDEDPAYCYWADGFVVGDGKVVRIESNRTAANPMNTPTHVCVEGPAVKNCAPVNGGQAPGSKPAGLPR